MSGALRLEAVVAAMQIESIDRSLWPEVTRRLTIIHGVFTKSSRNRRRH